MRNRVYFMILDKDNDPIAIDSGSGYPYKATSISEVKFFDFFAKAYEYKETMKEKDWHIVSYKFTW